MAARSRYEADKIAAIKSFANFCRGTELPKFPLELFFEVSNVCNLKCAMCAEFSAINPYRLQIIKGKDRGLIKPDEFDNNFLSLLKSALFVHCSGFGESTIHPQFREIIKLVSSYDVMIHFITNGQELNSDLAEFLVEQGVHKIMVSCSGTTKEDYEKVYIGGNYDTLVDGLKRLKEAKQAKGTRYPLVEINSLGFHHHVANFDKFVDLMADCGADIIHLKKLQPYDRIPELYEHVSYMRPWVEGVVIQRALEIGARRGVVVGVNQYLHNAVETEEEYQELIKRLETEVDGKLSFAKFGENTIDTFAQISRAPKAEGSAAKKLRPIIRAEDSLDQASQMLDIAELKEAGTGNDKFYCMEPFKTAYVSNNGGLRPCCFSGSDHPFLGSVKIEDGIHSWRGAGFQALQKGVLEGKYPTNMCTRCLKDKIGPTDHFAFNIVQDYLDWYVDRFRSDLSGTLEEEAPDVIRLMQQSPSKSIVKRFKGEEAPPRVAQDAKMQLEIILAAGAQIPVVDASVKGLLEGWFERVSGSKVEGWVWSPAFTDVRLPIRVWHNEVLIAEGIANRSRGDLERAGKGDGCHGFMINLPLQSAELTKQDITITIGNNINRLALRK